MGLFVDFVATILFGALAGWLTARIMHVKTEFWGNLLLGIIGSVVGSALLRLIGGSGVNGFTIYSLLVSVVGACISVWVFRRIDTKGKK